MHALTRWGWNQGKWLRERNAARQEHAKPNLPSLYSLNQRKRHTFFFFFFFLINHLSSFNYLLEHWSIGNFDMWIFSVATSWHQSLHNHLFEPEICLHSVQLRIWSTGGTPRSRAWRLVCPCCCCSRWQRSASSASPPTCCLPSSASPSPFASTSL